MSEHPMQGLMGTTMEKIREMVDVNTIIGEPIHTGDGTTVIPVSKVSFGFASGGSDIPSKQQKQIFGGASGAGVSISPVAFLVIQEDSVRLLQMSDGKNTAASLVNSAPELIDKVSGLFKKEKNSKKEDGTSKVEAATEA